MFEKRLTYDDLDISDKDLFMQMGYGDAVPGDDIMGEIAEIRDRIRSFLRPRFCFTEPIAGELDTEKKVLHADGCAFNVGRIITAQLRGAEGYSFFVATSGMEFEAMQRHLEQEGDMVKVFIADSFGSVIAEKTADIMERWLQVYINGRGWRHTNRFSPGYCGWHVSEQQLLFGVFSCDEPCGVRLTSSSLMVPIKSVSGVIGLGGNVKKLDYTCGLCDYAKCYKRRKRK